MSNNYTEGDFQTAQTLETFGFLPKLTQEEIHSQICNRLSSW
jgi:ribulose-bisphosphate carboxylase small chain